MNPIVLYSSHDTSRGFPAVCPQDGSVSFLDWASSDLTQYLGPPPSMFPSVCLTVNVSGVISPTLVGLVTNPDSWTSVLTASGAWDTQTTLQSVATWGAYTAGAQIEGPMLPLFQAGVFQNPNISPGAKLNLPLTYPLLAQYANTPGVCQQYWGLLKAMKPAWLNAGDITEVEALAQTYKVPIV